MLVGYSSLFIKSVKGPKTGLLYHVKCGFFMEESDGSKQVHMSVFDLNDLPINADVREVMTEAGFVNLIQNKQNLENTINKLVAQLGI